jgi:hypothetical protein
MTIQGQREKRDQRSVHRMEFEPATNSVHNGGGGGGGDDDDDK